MFKILCSVVFILSQLTIAAYANEVTIKRLISVATSNNPMIRAAEKEYAAQAAEVLPTYVPDNPVVGYEYMSKDGEQKYSLNQMFDFPLKTYFKGGVQGRKAAIAKYKYELVKEEVRRDVLMTYYEITYYNAIIAVEMNKKQELSLFKNIAEVKYKTGRAEQADYVRAKVDMLLSTKKIITLSAERETRMEMLKRLLNVRTLPTDIEFSYDEIPVSGIEEKIAQASNTFAGILVKKEAYAIAADESTIAAFEFLPDISLMVTYSAPMGNWSVFIGLSVPLYFPFKETPMANSAGDMREAAKYELADTVNGIIADTASKLQIYRQSRDVLTLFQGNIIHEARQALDASFKSYETDRMTFLSLLQNVFMLYDYYAEQEMARMSMYTSWAWLSYYASGIGK